MPLRFVIRTLLLLAPFATTGCVSYIIVDDVQHEDHVVEDSRDLGVEIVQVSPPRVHLKLVPGGEQKIERTTKTDRRARFKVESGLVKTVKDVGLSPTLVFVIPFGLAADVAEFAITAPTRFPAGLFQAIDPKDRHSTVVETPAPKVPEYRDVIVRFGPRDVQTVRCQEGSRITVDARGAARKALRDGEQQLRVQVRLEQDDLRGSFTLDRAALQAIAGEGTASE